MKQQKKFLHMISRNTVFARTFYGVFLASLIILAVFYTVLNTTSLNHQRYTIASTNMNLTQQSAAYVETTIDAFAQGMAQTMWSRDFISYTISPNEQDGALIYRISMQLRNNVEDNQLLKKAIFFPTLSNSVIKDSFSIESMETFSDFAILNSYTTQHKKENEINQNRTSSWVTFYDNRLFLITELNIASPIGVLIYELDSEVLTNSFFEQNLIVFDEKGVQIGESEYETIDLSKSQLFITAEQIKEENINKSASFYSYVSPKTGWTFLTPVAKGTFNISLKLIALVYLPVFLLLTLIALFLAWYISKTLYTPINRLMQLVSASEDGNLEKINEVDFLELAYSGAVQDRNRLQGIMNRISPEVIESMLRNLMIGKKLEEKRVEEILEGVGNPVLVKGSFYVIVCVFEPPEGRELNDTEVNLHLLAVKNLVGRLCEENYKTFDVRTGQNTIAIVCCFKEDDQTSYLTAECRKIKQLLRSNTELLPFKLLCERGNVYKNLLYIRHSYQEAIEKIHYLQYVGEDEKNLTIELVNNTQNYLHQYAKVISNCIADEDTTNKAEATLEEVFYKIGENAKDFNEYKDMAKKLMDEILERAIVYPLTKDEQKVLNRCRNHIDDADIVTKEQILKASKEDYHAVFKIIFNYGRKNRYKYIERAKEYIGANYMDSSLSLNMVGEHVGISASYLSELFNEIAGDKFSSYLAAFRVEKARQLLVATKLPMGDVGFRCGFNSVQNFIRVFKKYAGKTPGQYREEG